MSTEPAQPDRAPVVALRPLGSPLALGLAGLVTASLVTSGLELGWISAGERPQVALVLLALPFPAQFVASLFAFLARDGAAGTAMGVLAGAWLGTGLVWLSTPSGTASGALGLLLLAVAGLLAASAAGAAAGKRVPAAVFTLAALRFALSGIAQLSGSGNWENAAGVTGVAVLALAGYTMLAAVLEDSRQRTVLPLGRPRPVDREAGLRQQL